VAQLVLAQAERPRMTRYHFREAQEPGSIIGH
jgi:hypothetical protein